MCSLVRSSESGLCGGHWSMMQDEQRFGAKGKFGVAATVIITELNLEHAIIELLNHRSDLPPNQRRRDE